MQASSNQRVDGDKDTMRLATPRRRSVAHDGTGATRGRGGVAGGSVRVRVPCHFGANTVFQSDFMSTTVQPRALASSSALSSLPMCESRS